MAFVRNAERHRRAHLDTEYTADKLDILSFRQVSSWSSRSALRRFCSHCQWLLLADSASAVVRQA